LNYHVLIRILFPFLFIFFFLHALPNAAAAAAAAAGAAGLSRAGKDGVGGDDPASGADGVRRSLRQRAPSPEADGGSTRAEGSATAPSGPWEGLDLSGQLCCICARGIELGPKCQTCKSVYHLACLSDTYRNAAEDEREAWKQCPTCFLSTASSLCKCGSAKHRTPAHRDCPLNPRSLVDAASADATASSAGDATMHQPPAPAQSGWSWTRDAVVTTAAAQVDPEIMEALIRNYSTILRGVAEPGWTGPTVDATSAEQLMSFPLEAFLQVGLTTMANRVVIALPRARSP